MKKNLTMTSFLFLIIFLLIEVSSVFAVGALFSRPRFSNQEYQKMWIKSISTNVEITEQIAVTHLDQVFYNELNQSVEAIFIFPLPENATITELVYWVNGQRFVAEIKERQQAVAEYNEKLRQWLDPALLEYLGDNLFRLSIVPIDPLSEVRAEITYIEPLKYDFGIVNYEFMLNTLDLSSNPVETVMVDVNSSSKYAYQSFTCPSHQNSTALQITEVNEKHYHLQYGDENFYPDKDIEINFRTARDEVEFNILTYTPSEEDSIGDDSFYALWITSPDVVGEDEFIPQNIVFTADVSSSMEGERLVQLKEAMYTFIDLLKPEDKFNIVTFGTFVEKFKPDLIEASEENKELAREYVSDLYALGLTNIDEALSASMEQSFNSTSQNSLVFITDGDPTWGETNIDSIVSRAKRNNTSDLSLFSFGVGEDISHTLLERIAAENHGYATFIASDDSIALVVNNLSTRISKPVMTNIGLDLGSLDSYDFYPKTINDLFWGSQLLYLGKYKNSGTFNVTLSGIVRDGNYNYITDIYFPDTTGGHQFVPRLWAREKIDYLLTQIELYGEQQELVDQIIELSLMFKILTPYTAFYADPDDDPDTTPVEEVDEMVAEFKLMQNYPNPFNPSTNITYSLPSNSSAYNVTLKIYNSLGELVLVLVNASQSPGTYTVKWDGKDMNGYSVPSGLYLYTLEAGNLRISQKMMLLR